MFHEGAVVYNGQRAAAEAINNPFTITASEFLLKPPLEKTVRGF
jgi:hypothetical protein